MLERKLVILIKERVKSIFRHLDLLRDLSLDNGVTLYTEKQIFDFINYET